MPFTQNKFGDLYGYGNLDSIFYCFLPGFIMIKFNPPLYMRIIYASLFTGSYTLARIFLVKDHKRKFWDFYRINNNDANNILNKKMI